MLSDIVFAGYALPSPDIGSTRLMYKEWAEGSGRTSSGTATGTVRYSCWKLNLKFHILPAAVKNAIDNVLIRNRGFAQLSYKCDGQLCSGLYYANDPTYSSEIICGNGEVYYVDYTVNFIEKAGW